MLIILWWRMAIKKFYVASDRVEKVMTDEKHQPLEYSIIKTIKGSELIGKRFEPLFENPWAGCA